MSIGSLAFWLCGPLALCYSWLSAFSPCVAFWIYLPGFGPLVSLVGGVEWCYPCWDPARFVLLHLSFLFICLLFLS